MNLVPGLFPQKMGGAPHPFFEGKALGTRLDSDPRLHDLKLFVLELFYFVF